MTKKLSKDILEKYKIDKHLIDRFTNVFGKSIILLSEDYIDNIGNFNFEPYAHILLENIALLEYLSYIELLQFYYSSYKLECMKIYQQSKLEKDENICFKEYLKNINYEWMCTIKEMNRKFISLYNESETKYAS